MTRKNIDTSTEYAVIHNDSVVSNPSQSMTDAVNQTGIYQHFSKVSELYSSEAEVLGAAIRLILANKGTVTNKAIILHLINQLETTSDIVQLDILRGALEMVVGVTPDDSGF
ncbi:biofilm/acid-resistance regulator YmgB/AriR [Rahnella woolbedingensis]|uniref:Biofilm development protein AriR n=1 Tax=Rahnella woolbedingensis TaxID=1510574 RepID=A0A419N8U4_9GAMM|nr:biofilm/acid-resistance regulator YmgB/AriR [Rahnella woolbedingensis]RJT44094.1 biofilm development protein AriR [Rahnella woolbedingensis]